MMQIHRKSRWGEILNLTFKHILGKDILKLKSLGQQLLRGGML